MRSNIFYISKWRMAFSKDPLPAFEAWVSKYNIFKRVDEDTYGIDLVYKNDMSFYEEKVALLDDEDEIQLYWDVLNKLSDKESVISSIWQKLKHEDPNVEISNEEEIRMIKRSNLRPHNWFNKEKIDYLPKVGFEVDESQLAVEDLLSYELVLRPHMLEICKDLLLNIKPELMKFEDYGLMLEELNNLIPLLSNMDGFNNFNSSYEIIKIFRCLTCVSADHKNLEKGLPLQLEDQNPETKLRMLSKEYKEFIKKHSK
jgi:hypothetical protein